MESIKSVRENADYLLSTTGQILPQLINPETTDSPTETLKLQISPIVIIFATTACGAVNSLSIDFYV
jgi:hypothetical protein